MRIGRSRVAKMPVTNRLARVRRARGIAASDLAQRVGVGRQTIYAIESGTYVPNTAVALKLARALDTSVHSLFLLGPAAEPAAPPTTATVLSARPAAKGQPLRICRVQDRWVGVPVSAAPCYLPDADGIGVPAKAGRREANLTVFPAVHEEPPGRNRLVIAGCDPAAGLLSHVVEQMTGVEIVPAVASSQLALTWLRDGIVHIAGSHLEDGDTGEFNLPFIRKHLRLDDAILVTLARWEAGLVVAAGNPKALRAIDDLAQSNVTFVNREPGSGSRALLLKLLKKAGLAAGAVRGFDRVADGHLAAAHRVASGDADACLAPRSAARGFGLDFIPLQSERYDLVLRQPVLDLPAVRIFLDVLQRAPLRRKLEAIAGYDTTETGTLVA